MENKKIKPKNLSGFIELLPADQILFNKLYDTIKTSYERFGFTPLDTPILEYSEVLLAKAGGETEKQIYRFNKGDTDLSMRFDLTVPLAKYVALHSGEISFPFRRYQMGKVFRGERTQRGRFREFYQCDIDIIGENELSIMSDAEIPSIIYTTFINLGFNNFTIRINNRKILNGFFSEYNIIKKASEILRIIDKLEKIGNAEVIKEMKKLELSEDIIEIIINFVNIQGTQDEMINMLKNMKLSNEVFNEGVKELEEVVDGIRGFKVPDENFVIDFKIARGLDYYTGTVYETILNDFPSLGSVCSGGRYDNLAQYYTNKKLPGVGISIGFSRLFYQLKEAGVFQAMESTTAKVLVIPLGQYLKEAQNISNILRKESINTELFYTQKSVKAMLNYANKIGVPYVIFVGEDEVINERYTLKDMKTGSQVKYDVFELVSLLK